MVDLNAVKLDLDDNETAIFLFGLKISRIDVVCLERNLSRKCPSVVFGLYTESSRDFSQWFPAPELIMT